MQDYWNDPPDDNEPPEWYAYLEDSLGCDPPEEIAAVIRKAMEDYNKQFDIDPGPDPGAWLD